MNAPVTRRREFKRLALKTARGGRSDYSNYGQISNAHMLLIDADQELNPVREPQQLQYENIRIKSALRELSPYTTR
jgi:hypothetical protein